MLEALERRAGVGCAGVSSPMATPASVGCTPAAYAPAQATIAGGKYAQGERAPRRFIPSMAPSPSAAIARPVRLIPAEKTSAITSTAPRSSMTASVSSVRRSAGGARRPSRARTPTANAMSVAMGMPHPPAASVPALIAR